MRAIPFSTEKRKDLWSFGGTDLCGENIGADAPSFLKVVETLPEASRREINMSQSPASSSNGLCTSETPLHPRLQGQAQP